MPHDEQDSEQMERLVVLKGKPPTDLLYFEHYFRYLFAEKYIQHLNVLDCACGSGYGSYLLAQKAKAVVGMDISQAALDLANANWVNDKVRYVQQDALVLSKTGMSFDAVVSFETIEHLSDPGLFVDEVYSCLNDNGCFIVSTPNKNVYLSGQEPNVFHVHELSPEEFMEMLTKKFRCVELFGQIPIKIMTPSKRLKKSMAMKIKSKISAMGLHHMLGCHSLLYALYKSYMRKKYAIFPITGKEKHPYVYMIAVCQK